MKDESMSYLEALKEIKRLKEAVGKIKDDISRYRADCEFVNEFEEPECRQCNANVFDSIERIIDKHLKEVE